MDYRLILDNIFFENDKDKKRGTMRSFADLSNLYLDKQGESTKEKPSKPNAK